MSCLYSFLSTMRTTLSYLISHSMDGNLLENNSFPIAMITFLKMSIMSSSSLTRSTTCSSRKTHIFLNTLKSILKTDSQLNNLSSRFSIPLANLSILLGHLIISYFLLPIIIINRPHSSITQYLISSINLGHFITILSCSFHLLKFLLKSLFQLFFIDRKMNS